MNLLGTADLFGTNAGPAAHQLVDFTPIEEADQLLSECQMFLQQSGDPAFILFPMLTRVKNWRMKRRDNRLISVYEQLYPRITASEKKLRQIMDDVVEKKADIRNQARHLQARLQSCIRHNKSSLQATEAPVDELRLLINKLSNESALLKEMIEFNKELLRFGTVEKVSKGQSFVKWGGMSKAPTKKVVTEAELQRDDLHPEIEVRLVSLRKLKEQFVSCLSSVLEVRGTQLANLDNCEHSLKIVNSILNRSGIMASAAADGHGMPPLESDGDGAVIGSPNGGASKAGKGDVSTPGTAHNGVSSPNPTGNGHGHGNASANGTPLQRTFTFDHARCQDCSYGYLKTCDCTNHLNALQKQSTDANDRLQQLVEMRERVYEEAEKLIQQQGLDPSSLGAGSKSGSSSSFSEMMRGVGGVKADSPNGEKHAGRSLPSTPSGSSQDGTFPPRPSSPSTSDGANLKAGIAAKDGRRDQSQGPDSVWTEVDGRHSK